MLARGCTQCASRARIAVRSRSSPSPSLNPQDLLTLGMREAPPSRVSQRRTLSYAAQSVGTCKAAAGGAAAAAASVGGGALLVPLMEELDRMAPSFDVSGEDITILRTPAEFYSTLKDRISKAKTRIFLSTLYIGKSETELLETLRDALRRNPRLRLSILTDALRGTRESPDPSCASLLAPLVAEFGGDRVEVRMYHTPNLTGVRKRYVPRRINEGWGLQHMKLYGIDDEIIISGANLSTDYFTDRQDRYHLFSSAPITEHFWKIHAGVSSFSFRVDPAPSLPAGYTLSWPASNAAPSPLLNPRAFVRHTTPLLRALLTAPQGPRALDLDAASSSTPSSTTPSSTTTPFTTPSSTPSSIPLPSTAFPSSPSSTTTPRGHQRQPDTRVYLLGQMTQVMRPDASTELPILTRILARLTTSAYAGSSWVFTAGYFNPDPSLTKLLLATQSSSPSSSPSSSLSTTTETTGTSSSSTITPTTTTGIVITAAPEANGFYRSRGVSGLLPDAYVLLARRFLQAAHDRGRASDILLKEWRRGTAHRPGGWTYHAKGLWVTLPGDRAPCMSIVGSSNYTRRSYSLDLEAGALLVTRNEGLRRRLGEEQAWLQEHAAEVTLDDFTRLERRVSLKVRLAMWIVRMVGGAL